MAYEEKNSWPEYSNRFATSTMTSRKRSNLVEKAGILHIYYANKTFKHWKKRWLHLQDQHLAIYQDSRYKRQESTTNITKYRVSVTNPNDAVSHKGYTFKIYNPDANDEKPIYLAADSKQSMTQWINALRLSASIVNDLLVEPHFATDLHSIATTDSESDYDAWMNNGSSSLQYKSYKPAMPVATTTTLNDQTRYSGPYDEEEDQENHRWYRPRSSSPPYPLSANNGVPSSSAATMGSWGFDVNRSTNGQIPTSFTSNTTHNNNDHRTITRTSRRMDETVEDYNERFVDRASLHPPPPQRFKLRTPTLSRHRDGNDFAVVDRLVLGPSRLVQSDYYPSNESPQQQYMPSSTQSRQSSTRSILRRRSKSIGDFTAPTTSTSPPPSTHLTQSYHPYQYQERPPTTSPHNHHRNYTEHELMAWQNRMLERDHRQGNPMNTQVPPSNSNWTQSPRMSSKRGGFNSSQSSNRPMPVSTRPISSMSNMSVSQRSEHDYQEPNVKSSRFIKRYIELLHHLQTFYERMTEQLYGGDVYFRNSSSSQQSVFIQHCRKIAEQLQRSKTLWDRKATDLQYLLKDERASRNETTFLQRRSTLINLIHTLNTRKDLDDTQLSILNDIERILQEDRLAVQLQDELATLLQHQSLLNDFSALLQWNRQIYSPNEQNRVENILPLLREQSTTTDGYVSHVSQQLTDLVSNLRSLERYILSYINTIPSLDDGVMPTNRSGGGGWRPYHDTDIDSLRTRNQSDRTREEYHRSSRQQSRPMSVHTPTYQHNGSPNYRSNHHSTEPYEWQRQSPSPPKARSVSANRYTDPSEPVRGPSNDDFDRDGFRTSTKWSPRRNHVHLNTNNSNNNPPTAPRIATVKSAKRDNNILPNSILKPYAHTRATIETKKDFDIDTIDKEIYKPDKVDIPDRLIDFGNDEQMLTANERLAKIKKKEEVRKMLSKQSMQEMNEQDYNDGDFHTPYHHRRLEKDREKALNLQSALAEEAKEKSRQVAAKHYLNKSYQQRASRRNS